MSTTAAETGPSGSMRKNTVDEELAVGDGLGKVPFRHIALHPGTDVQFHWVREDGAPWRDVLES